MTTNALLRTGQDLLPPIHWCLHPPKPVASQDRKRPAEPGNRGLGIPTVKDRVVQMAVNLVLMPIFEADFHPFSFGFRPRRSAHQAVEAIREGMRMGKTEVVDAD